MTVDEAQAALDLAQAAEAFEARMVEGAELNVAACGIKGDKAQAQLDAAADARVVAERDLAEVKKRHDATQEGVAAAQAVYDEAKAAAGTVAGAGVANGQAEEV